MMIYDCMDAGRVKAFFGQTIKEITPDEIVLMSARERDPKRPKRARELNDAHASRRSAARSPRSSWKA